MADVAPAPELPSAPACAAADSDRAARATSARDAALVNAGWLGTSLALSIHELPFKLLLKEVLHFSPQALSGFMAITHIPIYVKPFAGILSDAVPLFGSRRKHYLTTSLVVGALFWALLALVPRNYHTLLWTYFALQICLTMTSTVLGGLMVEIGKRDACTGRLSAQRLGITRIVGLVSGPLSGWLAKMPFLLTGAVCGLLYLLLAPFYALLLREPRTERSGPEVLAEVRRQWRGMCRSRSLWSAAALVVLVVAAPGFNTPLLYYQREVLRFSPEFIGLLSAVIAVGAMGGAFLYGLLCRRVPLRTLLALSIVNHAVMTLFYLLYRSPVSALVITGLEAATMALALLPLYDLAARATPRGSEALGYSLMMSVWNFTNAMSDLFGSWLFDRWGLTFAQLVWVNAGTTLLVLLAVPLLPAVLVNRKDGDPEPEEKQHSPPDRDGASK